MDDAIVEKITTAQRRNTILMEAETRVVRATTAEYVAAADADIVRVLTSNADRGRALVAGLASGLEERPAPCPEGCDRALEHAIITPPEARDPELLRRLDAVLGRVLAD